MVLLAVAVGSLGVVVGSLGFKFRASSRLGVKGGVGMGVEVGRGVVGFSTKGLEGPSSFHGRTERKRWEGVGVYASFV